VVVCHLIESKMDVCSMLRYITNQLCGAEYHSRGYKLCSYSVVSQHFMEPEGSLPRSQELSTCTYPEPDQLSPHHPVLSLKGPS
jgi:hypothetical protein